MKLKLTKQSVQSCKVKTKRNSNNKKIYEEINRKSFNLNTRIHNSFTYSISKLCIPCSNRKKRINELYYSTEKNSELLGDFVVCDSSDRKWMPLTSAFSEACSAWVLLSSCILIPLFKNCFDVNYMITSRWLRTFIRVFLHNILFVCILDIFEEKIK